MTHPACCDRDVWHLPPLDPTVGDWDAADERAALERIGDPERRARAAADYIAKAQESHEKYRVARDAAAWTIAQEYHVRRGASIPAAMGVVRARWKSIRDQLAEQPPARVPSALTRLPELATKTARYAKAVAAGNEVRDQAVGELLSGGWTNAEVARLIGRDPSRVSKVRHRPSKAA